MFIQKIIKEKQEESVRLRGPPSNKCRTGGADDLNLQAFAYLHLISVTDIR